MNHFIFADSTSPPLKYNNFCIYQNIRKRLIIHSLSCWINYIILRDTNMIVLQVRKVEETLFFMWGLRYWKLVATNPFKFIIKLISLYVIIFRVKFINSKMTEDPADRKFPIHIKNRLRHFIPLILDCTKYMAKLFLLEWELYFPFFMEVTPLIPLDLTNI